MSQTLNNHIWIQMGLGYIVKQIYDKHKAIWWAKIKARKTMAREIFIKQQKIAYLDCEHKIGNWCLHKNPVISLHTWVFGSIHNRDTKK
jgi:hypothetical protein